MTLNEALSSKCTVGVADVYRDQDFNLYFNEKRFEIVGFRVPAVGELCVHINGDVCTVKPWERLSGPRLIVKEKSKQPTIKDIYGTDNPPIPEGYEQGDFKELDKQGEIFLTIYEMATFASTLDLNCGKYRIILKKLPTLVFKPIRKGRVESGEHYKFDTLNYVEKATMSCKDPSIIAYRLEEQKD